MQHEAMETVDIEPRLARLHEDIETIIGEHLLPFIESHLSMELFHVAWHEFLNLGNASVSHLPEEAMQQIYYSLFLPWCLFHWAPHQDLDGPEIPNLPEQALALFYLQSQPEKLAPEQQTLIQAICAGYYSIYEVLAVVPGQALQLKDLFLDTTSDVQAYQETEGVAPGDMIYAQVFSFDGCTALLGVAPFSVFGPEREGFLLFRQELEEDNAGPLNAELLKYNFEQDVRDEFFAALELSEDLPYDEEMV